MIRNPGTKGTATVLVLLAGLLLLTGLPNINAGAVQSRGRPWEIQDPGEPVIRLHVLAHSDAPRDQAAKMEVVAAVQEILGTRLARGGTPVPRRMEEMVAALKRDLPARFPGQPLEISLKKEFFPLRTYGIRVFPPGEYLALKVIIGEGEGENWWCLLFPSLCFPLVNFGDQDEPAVGDDHPDPENQKRWWSFYLLEWLKRWWPKN